MFKTDLLKLMEDEGRNPLPLLNNVFFFLSDSGSLADL